MEELLNENSQLKQMAKKYFDEIQDLRDRNSQHENEIETLLKFNEKLLGIIEKQLHHRNIKSSEILSLQPISQRTQLQSNVFDSQFTNPMMNSQFGSPKPKEGYQPMGGIEKEEQLSIVISNEEKQKAENQGPQHLQTAQELLAEYRKPLISSSPMIPRGNVAEIQVHLKNQIDKFETFKRQSNTFYTSALDRLEQTRKKYCGGNAASELAKMIDSIDCEGKVKQRLKGFLDEKVKRM